MFKIFQLCARLVFFVLFAGLAYIAANVENSDSKLEKLKNLPDYDFRAAAKNLWEKGKSEDALANLEYAILNNLPDAQACTALRNKYLGEIAERSSSWGRLCAVGRGFITGNVDGADSLVGSVGADIVLYGDLRDIVKETFINETTDYTVLTLSGIGAATTLFPPADGALSLIKIAKKTHSLAKPLEKSVSDALKLAAKTSPSSATDILKKNLGPIANLSKKTKTWTGFSKILSCAESPKQIESVCKLLDKSPLNAAKLEQILSISGGKAKIAFDFAVSNSQKGLDYAYSLMRKGPASLKFAAKHPAMLARTAKNTYKAYPIAIEFYESYIASLLLKYGEAFRWILVLGLLTIAFAFVIPYKFIFRSSVSIAQKHCLRRAIFGSIGVCAALGALSAAAFAVCANYENTPEKISDNQTPNRKLSLADWAEKICQIDVRILEDAYINESFDISIKAPIIEIDGVKFAICGFNALGFGLKQIRDGGVYSLEFTVSKRSKNPESFSPEYVLADSDGNVLVPLPFKSAGTLATNIGDISAEDIAVFSKFAGYKNSGVEIAAATDRELTVNSECEDSDSLVTRNGGFFGLIKKRDGAKAYCQRFTAISTESFEKIPLVKPPSETYFKDFMQTTTKLQKIQKR